MAPGAASSALSVRLSRRSPAARESFPAGKPQERRLCDLRAIPWVIPGSSSVPSPHFQPPVAATGMSQLELGFAPVRSQKSRGGSSDQSRTPKYPLVPFLFSSLRKCWRECCSLHPRVVQKGAGAGIRVLDPWKCREAVSPQPGRD